MKRISKLAILVALLSLPCWGGFKALGKVIIASSGTPVQIYAGKPLIRANMIIIQVPADQTGPNIYVGDSTLNKSTRAGCAAVLTPGQSITLQAGEQAHLNPEDIFVDSDHSADAVQVSVVY